MRTRLPLLLICGVLSQAADRIHLTITAASHDSHVSTGEVTIPGHSTSNTSCDGTGVNNGPFSTDHIGANYEYPDGSQEKREKIVEEHVRYTQGFLWFLANDPRVPKGTQADVRRWGMA